MKKIIFTFVLSFIALGAMSDNYFTIGVNDTLRIDPALVGNGVTIPFKAHFDGRLDYWHLTMTYPAGLSNPSASEGAGMYVPFVNRWGHDTICEPELVTLQNCTVIMSTIVEPGYWDPDGDGFYDTYGTVKWEAGDYNPMFTVFFQVSSSFRNGYITISGLLSSTHDWRGGTIGSGVTFYKTVYIYAGYIRGDVDGSGMLTVQDLTMLVDYLVDGCTFDDFQQAAADVNGDGVVSILDVTALITILQNMEPNLQLDDIMNQFNESY